MVEIKKGEVPEVILNNLIKNSQLEQVFGINNVVLVDASQSFVICMSSTNFLRP